MGNSCSLGLRYVSKYKYLNFNFQVVFPSSVLEVGISFSVIGPFPDQAVSTMVAR